MTFAALLLRRSGAEHRFLAQKRLREGALRSLREGARRQSRPPSQARRPPMPCGVPFFWELGTPT
jgi:hypothetical protein